ncbi:MAG: hypothetical protein JOZ97_07455 [Candidatus Eremiobacteraeota bacterium]|nr:hypothetical protein [Candidatus Eremiobacteraeota bacterium]
MSVFDSSLRFLAAGVLLIIAIQFSSSAALARSGIAFDQILKPNVSAPLPKPQDFEALWNQALAAGAEIKPYDPRTVTPRVGLLLRVATLGDNLRFENPLDHTVEIDHIGQTRAIFVDLPARTYRFGAPRYFIKPLSATDIGTLQSGSARAVLTPSVHSVSDDWPTLEVAGIPFQGVSTRSVIDVNATAPCFGTQAVVFTTIFWTGQIPEPLYRDELYVMDALFLWPRLATLSACALRAVPLAPQLPGYPGFQLYRATSLMAGGVGTALRPMPPDAPSSVMIRGHLRILTDADMALFKVPAGFREASKITN